jgi:hypothetical protein
MVNDDTKQAPVSAHSAAAAHKAAKAAAAAQAANLAQTSAPAPSKKSKSVPPAKTQPTPAQREMVDMVRALKPAWTFEETTAFCAKHNYDSEAVHSALDASFQCMLASLWFCGASPLFPCAPPLDLQLPTPPANGNELATPQIA